MTLSAIADLSAHLNRVDGQRWARWPGAVPQFSAQPVDQATVLAAPSQWCSQRQFALIFLPRPCALCKRWLQRCLCLTRSVDYALASAGLAGAVLVLSVEIDEG